MLFQGRELRIGDKLVSKRKGVIEVNSMRHDVFEAIVRGFTYKWDYEGRYCLFEKEGVDLSWPDPSPEQPPHDVQREAEYRRIWIERAVRLFDGDIYVEMIKDGTARDLAMSAFDAADAFLVELKKRDGANNGTS